VFVTGPGLNVTYGTCNDIPTTMSTTKRTPAARNARPRRVMRAVYAQTLDAPCEPGAPSFRDLAGEEAHPTAALLALVPATAERRRNLGHPVVLGDRQLGVDLCHGEAVVTIGDQRAL